MHISNCLLIIFPIVFNQQLPGTPAHTGGRGARPTLRVHLCICMFLHRGRFWSSNFLLKGKCVAYLSHSCTVVSWGYGGLLLENVFEPHCLQPQKKPLHMLGEMVRVQYKVQFLTLLLTMEEGRGGSCPSYPQHRCS